MTTGQAVGGFLDNPSEIELAGVTYAFANSTLLGGACEAFAAAGTYTVSVQFKASSGSVTSVEPKAVGGGRLVQLASPHTLP